MRCIMCERTFSEQHGDLTEGFCSDECKNVYSHIYGTDELLAGVEQVC